jgi:regulator of protease activity HflC (stomatin/prohibitin superfamily)
VTIRVEAAVSYRVVVPVKAVVAIRDYNHGVLRIAQTRLRATLGQHQLDDPLANQAAINELLKQTIDTSTGPWGVNVGKVETKDVDLPETMKRAMARQAEAERERRAKVIATLRSCRRSPRSLPSTTRRSCCRFPSTCWRHYSATAL